MGAAGPLALQSAAPLEFALAYAALGWHVLPLKPRAKVPLTAHGFKDATINEATIRTWWAEHPGANIGIDVERSGLLVLDVDPRNDGDDTFDELQREHAGLRSEVAAFTGSAPKRGTHHVFALAPDVKAQLRLPGKLGPGVDVKHNGYIVAAPSVHPSGRRYEWEPGCNPLEGAEPTPLPECLRRLWSRQDRPAPATAAARALPAVRDEVARVRSALGALGASDADDREQWLRIGMALHSTGWGEAAYTQWCAWAQQSPKFDEDDSRKVWASFNGSGVTLGTLFSEAKRRGWDDPAARTAAPASTPAPARGDERPEPSPVEDGRGEPEPAAKAKRPAKAQSAALSTTEDALALALVEQHGAILRRSPGLEWMLNRGDHWTRDDQLKRFDLARTIARETALADGDKKLAARLGSAKTVAGIIALAQSDPRIALPADAWDADTLALNTPGGVIDLRTGKVRGRGGEYHTQIARVAPDGGMRCPLWDRFVADVFREDLELIEFVQRLLGYLLTGDRREQQLFFWYGLGANGKSTLADIVQWILGSYAVKLPATTLMQTGIGQHPTELAQLRGKRLAMSSEIDEGLYWNESRIKELTGDETLTARFMRQDFFEFRMTQKHVIVGNYKPRMRGGDAALARRFVLVPFNAKFQGVQRDPRMLEKLRAEAPAILAWMVRGAVKWADSGLAIPSSVSSASAEYMTDNDDVALWMDECCIRSVDAEARGGDLYESFASWIKARGQHAPSMRVWADRMNVVPGIVKRRSGGIRYSGLRLTAEEASRLAAPSTGWAR